MGRTAIADERLWSYLKRFDHSNGFAIGLIIGQASKTTDYIIHLARTPPPSPVNSKIDEESSEVPTIPSIKDVNESWVTEHALQVTRMLPGGMWVLGLFLVGSSDPFSSQADCSRFRSILRHIRTQLQRSPNLDGDSPPSEKLLLHVNNQTKLISCRAVDIDGGGSFLQASWKFQKDPIVWQQLECTLNLHQIFYLCEADSSPPIKRPLQAFVSAVRETVLKSVCTIGGELRDSDDILENIDKKRKGKLESRKSGSIQTNHAHPKLLYANLFLPMLEPSKGIPREEMFCCSEKMNVVGNIAGSVFLNPKATIEDAIKAMKQDLIRSLAARVEMHLDSLLEEEQGHSEGDPILHEPPRRVMIPLPYASVSLSDYLFPGEGPEEALTSSRELLDITIKESDVQKNVECQAEPDALDWTTSAENEFSENKQETLSEASSNKQRLFLILCVATVICAYLVLHLQRYMSSSSTTGSHR